MFSMKKEISDLFNNQNFSILLRLLFNSKNETLFDKVVEFIIDLLKISEDKTSKFICNSSLYGLLINLLILEFLYDNILIFKNFKKY